MKPSKIKNKPLTDVFIRSVKAQEKETSYSDGGGLSLLVHPNGYKYFQLRFSLNGKSRKTQLGVYPEMSLSKAREKADALKEDIAKAIDPILEKRKQRAFKLLNAEATFEVLCEKWLKNKSVYVSVKYHEKISGMIRANVIPRLGKYPINDISSQMILQTLKVMEKRGSLDLMGRVRKLIGEIFDYSKEQGLFFGENPAYVLRRSVSLRRHHKANYQTFKTDEDVGIFMNRLQDYQGGKNIKILIELQILTAARPAEIREAIWEEFDLDNAVWTIPQLRMKRRKDHFVTLSMQAIFLLKELKTLTGYSSKLFPSLSAKNGYVSEATTRKALRVLWPEYRIHPHGFRHLFSTFANEQRFHFDLIETALAHGDRDRVRGTYNRATYIVERRKLAQWYADFLDELKAHYNNKLDIVKQS